MEENEVKENSYDEKREIELIAQMRASHDVFGKALAEIEAMHANMPVAETETPAETPAEPEPRQEDGAKDETEAEDINEAEASVENIEDKSEADDETKYYY